MSEDYYCFPVALDLNLCLLFKDFALLHFAYIHVLSKTFVII